MTPQMWVTAIFGSAQILVTLIGAAVIYGGLKTKVASHDKAIENHGLQLDRHEGEIGQVFGRLHMHRG